jgi:hypothetical protein
MIWYIPGVVDDEAELVAGEGVPVDGQVRPAEVHHLLVDVAHDDPVDGVVPEHLPRRGTLAASHDEHRLWAARTHLREIRIYFIIYTYMSKESGLVFD